jgi:hypothetical protein
LNNALKLTWFPEMSELFLGGWLGGATFTGERKNCTLCLWHASVEMQTQGNPKGNMTYLILGFFPAVNTVTPAVLSPFESYETDTK